jgi:hypothetical protein
VKAIKPAVARTANAPEKEGRVGRRDGVGAYYELESGRVTFSQPIGASSGAHATSPEPHR